MADTFSVITQYPTLEFLGGTQTQDVMAIGYRTKAHQIYFEVRVPKKLYSTEIVHDYGIGYTGTLEQFFANPNVIGGEWTQTPTASGELQDNMTYTVQSDSGNSTGQVTFAFANLVTDKVNAAIDKLVTSLNNSESL